MSCKTLASRLARQSSCGGLPCSELHRGLLSHKNDLRLRRCLTGQHTKQALARRKRSAALHLHRIHHNSAFVFALRTQTTHIAEAAPWQCASYAASIDRGRPGLRAKLLRVPRRSNRRQCRTGTADRGQVQHDELRLPQVLTEGLVAAPRVPSTPALGPAERLGAGLARAHGSRVARFTRGPICARNVT